MNDSASMRDFQQQIAEMEAAAERDPISYLTFHEERRLYDHGDWREGGERSEAELEREAADGHPDALVRLGMRRERTGDIDGAIAAYQDAAAAGRAYAVFRLGFAHEIHRRDAETALRHYLDADAAGEVNGAGNAGRLLQKGGDLLAAEQAYGRCYERGGIRALSDHAGLMSNRDGVTPEEIRDVVVKLCEVEDMWVEEETRSRNGGDEGNLRAVSGQTGPPLAVFSGMWGRCDPTAMEAGVAAADRDGSASGAYHLGILLRERGNREEAAQVSIRAGERGYPAGWTNAAVNLAELGDAPGAERAARQGDAEGEVDSTVLLGLVLDEKGDRRGSIEANRKADAMGHKDGALHLGVDLMKEGQLEEAERAFQRALERGEPKAAQSLQVLRSMLGK